MPQCCRTGKEQFWTAPKISCAEEGYWSWFQEKMDRTPSAALWEPSEIPVGFSVRGIGAPGALSPWLFHKQSWRRTSEGATTSTSCHGHELPQYDINKHLHFPFVLAKPDGSHITHHTDALGQTQELLVNSEAPCPNLKILVSCDLPTYEWLLSLKCCSAFTLQECTGYWFEAAKNPLVALLFVVFVTIWDDFDILVPSSYASGQHVQSPLCPYPG